jgi:hypothetical protein
MPESTEHDDVRRADDRRMIAWQSTKVPDA